MVLRGSRGAARDGCHARRGRGERVDRALPAITQQDGARINGFDSEGNPLPLITAVGRGADEIGIVQLVADQDSVITIGATGLVILDAVQLVMGESAIDENPPVPTRRIPMGSGVDPSAIAKKVENFV